MTWKIIKGVAFPLTFNTEPNLTWLTNVKFDIWQVNSTTWAFTTISWWDDLATKEVKEGSTWTWTYTANFTFTNTWSYLIKVFWWSWATSFESWGVAQVVEDSLWTSYDPSTDSQKALRDAIDAVSGRQQGWHFL